MAIRIEDLAWTLGDKLAKARRVAGLDQDDMSAAVGVSRALVSKWERDCSQPRVGQLVKWADTTGFPVDWFTTIGYNALTSVRLGVEQMELLDERGRIAGPATLAAV